MADIWFDARYDELISEIVDAERCFSSYADLACFAAAVGWKNGGAAISKKGKVAPHSVFVNSKNSKEGLVYAISLIKSKDANSLREDNSEQCWKYFQDAVTCGMFIMEQWFYEYPSKGKKDVILSKMLEKAHSLKSVYSLNDVDDEDPEEIEF